MAGTYRLEDRLRRPRARVDLQAVAFDAWKGTSVSWDLKPGQDGSTEVWFSHDGWPAALPAKETASVNVTWGGIVARLKEYAETGKPVPYFP
jgi:uncharacterized protein YndB with AHSA1/START domain